MRRAERGQPAQTRAAAVVPSNKSSQDAGQRGESSHLAQSPGRACQCSCAPWRCACQSSCVLGRHACQSSCARSRVHASEAHPRGKTSRRACVGSTSGKLRVQEAHAGSGVRGTSEDPSVQGARDAAAQGARDGAVLGAQGAGQAAVAPGSNSRAWLREVPADGPAWEPGRHDRPLRKGPVRRAVLRHTPVCNTYPVVAVYGNGVPDSHGTTACGNGVPGKRPAASNVQARQPDHNERVRPCSPESGGSRRVKTKKSSSAKWKGPRKSSGKLRHSDWEDPPGGADF